MKLVSIPANPVPDNFVTGTLKTPDGVSLRFARWLPPAGRRGTVCIFQGRAEWIEKYFETVRDLRARGFAVATLDWRGQGLVRARAERPPQGLCARFLRIRHRSRNLHARGRLAGLPAADLRHRSFDRRDRADPRRPSRSSLVRSHGADRAADRARRRRLLDGDRSRRSFARCAWPASAACTCPRATPASSKSRPFVGNILTSDPVRYARNAAILEAEPALALGAPTVAWTDAAFRAMRSAARTQLSGADPPADPDRRRRQ